MTPELGPPLREDSKNANNFENGCLVGEIQHRAISREAPIVKVLEILAVSNRLSNTSP